MVDDCLNYLLDNFNKYNIYVHNLSGFDVVYLLNSISKFGSNAEVIMRDDKFISISLKKVIGRINVKPTYNTIYLKDSLLILPSSLKKLGKSFGVGEKIEFDFEVFNKSSISDPSVRQKVLKYNLSDCVLLYNIIYSFSSLVFDLFKIDVHKHPTLSSIAFAIYRKDFMKKANISVSSSNFYNSIKSGYLGGAVDVYKPRIENGFYYEAGGS